MKRSKQIVITCLSLLPLIYSSTSSASPAVDQLLEEFKQQGATEFNADAGKKFWTQQFTSANAGQARSCASCHTANLRDTGKHAITGKEIKPLAPSVMSKRLTNPTKIKKWFKRNCEWVTGSECSAQEKANILTYLKDL